jgi:hypothetical protein
MFIIVERWHYMNTIMKKQSMAKDTDLLRKAITAFNDRFTGLKALEFSATAPLPQVGNQRHDTKVHLRSGKRESLYQAEIKPRFSHTVRQLLLMQKASANRPLLLVTHYVNPEMADQLIRDNMEFIDSAGNAFINLGFLRIISKGNLPKNRAPLPSSPRLFKASGLKVVFALLSRPDLITGTLREIATKSGVSLGTAAGIVEEIKARLYLIEDNKGTRRLIRKKDLFEAWVTAYPEQLRPKIHLGKYRGEHGWWHEKVLQPAWAQWGGEVAASRLTNYLFPQAITVYLVGVRLDEFLLENKLRLDGNGTVEILERFWPTGDLGQILETVHPMLVYADLIAMGNERNIETAKIIYDQHIARYLRED